LKSPLTIILFGLLALLTAHFFPAIGSASDDLPETFRVNRIDIKGAHDIKPKAIRSVLSIQPPPRWRFWTRQPVASQEDLSDDTDRISQLYKSFGFYQTEVTDDVRLIKDTSDSPPIVRVTYHIEEGMPVTVDRILVDIDGQEPPIPVDKILNAIPLKTGMRFEEKSYRESKQVIQSRFGGSGYPLAKITGQALIYPATGKAVVTFSVDPGRLCYFGETTVIEAASVVSEKILLRSRTYRPGEIYDTRKVDKSQRNLYNLDVFKAAVIEPGTPDPDSDQIPMSLELKPKKKRSIKLGIGYGDEDGLRLRAGLIYRNPFGRGGKLTFDAKRTDLLNKASAGYSQPYFWDARTALDMETGVLREFFDSYESSKLYGTARITRAVRSHLDFTAAYLLEYSEVVDLALTDPEELAQYREDHSFFTSSVFLEMTKNTTDSDTNPKRGSVVSGSVEVASTLFGSELTYIKPSLELKRYIKLPFETILAGRVRLETIFDAENNQDIPIFKRLFLGGANSVRGYGFQELGPLDETGNPKGGQSSALANIELRHQIVGVLSGVLFLDMGMIDEDKLRFNSDGVRSSAGAGLRVDTPLGPIRLDFGYQLNPAKYIDEDETIPLEKTDRWHIHFNIGHAF